ncbi:hypothetical protein [Oceanibacterium hippocampi]|uniref:Uncharacterized protein n=1 Tax=Oceanibacterium hippocampi TaxID=745714 RepID=A0A1Y5U5V8_9PROT|nr:hypothetical protein [Oceanibacterium hippocampi]SLN77593.1 hypothetical protein OCH7691_04473 [Oceanibacterium hippocampi]
MTGRQALREHVAGALLHQTAAEGRVYTNRFDPQITRALAAGPVIGIYGLAGRRTPDDAAGTVWLWRSTLTLALAVAERRDQPAEAAAEALLGQVLARLDRDPALHGLTGDAVARALSEVSVEFGPIDDVDLDAIGVEVRLVFEHLEELAAPEADAFERLHVDYDLVEPDDAAGGIGPAGEVEAQDTITLPQD